MDPQANLQEQERIADRIHRVYRGRTETRSDQVLDEARLRRLRIDLRAWLARGGFAPDWSACPRASRFFARAGGR